MGGNYAKFVSTPGFPWCPGVGKAQKSVSLKILNKIRNVCNINYMSAGIFGSAIEFVRIMTHLMRYGAEQSPYGERHKANAQFGNIKG